MITIQSPPNRFDLNLRAALSKGENGKPILTNPGNLVLPGEIILASSQHEQSEKPIPYQNYVPGKNAIQTGTQIVSGAYGIVIRSDINTLSVFLPILFNKNKTTAYILVFPLLRKEQKILPSADQLIESVKSLNLVKMLSKEQILNQLSKLDVEKIWAERIPVPVIIARGLEAKAGQSEYYVNFLKSNRINGKIMPDGKIDFHEQHYIQEVKRGTPIAQKIPEEKAIDGETVFGQIIKAPYIQRQSLLPGQHIVESKKKANILISEIDGCYQVHSGRFHISQQAIIPTDVGTSTGNIRFSGDIEINGNINPGFKVICSGDLTVKGDIEGASVEVKGNVTVLGGIIGNEKGIIRTKGSLIAKYIENARIYCQGDLFVDKEIVNTYVECEGKILVISEKNGRIVGGHISSRLGITVNTIGSTYSDHNAISVGHNPKIEEKILFYENILNKKDKEIATAVHHLDINYDIDIKDLPQAKDRIKAIPEIRRGQFLSMISRLMRLNRQRKKILRIIDLYKIKLILPEDVNVNVIKNIHPPATIQIGKFTYNITEETGPKTFSATE